MLGYRANTERNGREQAIKSYMQLDLFQLTPFGFSKIDDKAIDIIKSMEDINNK